jgi:hypothetical protein
MPLQKLQFRPGVNREGTTLSNEGGWFESDKVRFRSGYPEKIGGWQRDGGVANTSMPFGTFASGGTTTSATPSSGAFWGVAKAIWNWLNLSGYNLVSIGTNLKYYIQNSSGGTFNDITPIRRTTSAGAVTFAASGVGSPVITVTDAGHGAQTGDFVAFSGATTLSTATSNYSYSVGNPTLTLATVTNIPNGTAVQLFTTGAVPGNFALSTTYYVINSSGPNLMLSANQNGAPIIPAVGGSGTQSLNAGITALLLNREFQITYVSSNTYYITAGAYATLLDTLTGGASTIGSYQITTGNRTFTFGTGWGTGGWGGLTTGYPSTGWGSPAPDGLGVGVQLRLWSQSNYGEDLIFNPRGGAMYYWANNNNPNIYDRGQVIKAGTSVTTKNGSGGTTTFTPDSTCPSVANFVMVSDASRFTFAFGCNDPTGVYATPGQDPMQIRWSDQNSVATWAPAITNQAGGIRLSHGSTIVAAIQTRQEIVVLTDAAIYSMQYLGAPYVWGTQLLGDNISIVSPNAMATVNNVTYWMGADKFYMYSGRVETLPCALRQYIYDDINLTQAFQFFAGTNEGYNEIWWFYCSLNSTTVDKYVIYNHLERTWYYGTLGRSAWCDSPLRSQPMSAGYASNNSRLIYQETGVDNNETGTPVAIDAYVQSSDFDIGDGHNFGFVWRLIPDITFDGSYVNNPTATFTVRPRQNPGANYGSSDNPSVISAQNFAGTRSYNVQQFTEQVYVRIRGRQMAFRIESTDLGVQWQLGAPRIDVRPDGRR